MATEKPKSFLSTPKGIITVVSGVIGAAALIIVGVGIHQGWFSSDSGKAPDQTNTNTGDKGNDKGKEGEKKQEVPAGDTEKL